MTNSKIFSSKYGNFCTICTLYYTLQANFLPCNISSYIKRIVVMLVIWIRLLFLLNDKISTMVSVVKFVKLIMHLSCVYECAWIHRPTIEFILQKMVSSTRESGMKHFLKKGKDFSFSTQKPKLSHALEEISHIASNLPQNHSLEEDQLPCKAKVYCRCSRSNLWVWKIKSQILTWWSTHHVDCLH
jgi:hypothetical protein